eukprot:gene12658-13958_t
MKFLIFASFLVFASARSTVHLLGDEECTMGPSYWCKNIQTAKQCGAVKYCSQTYWPKHLKSTTCDTCKEVVGMVHSFLANNLTETEVIQGLNAACSMLGSYAAECKSLVNTYGKEILSLVTQYTANPTMICQMVEMCSKAGRSVEIETPAKMQKIMPIVFAMKKHFELKQSALCTVCEFGMSELDSLISKESTEKEITAYVEKLCNYLPSTVKTECDALISEYGKQIIALLVKQLSPKKICTELKLCSASIVKMIKLRKSSVKSGVTCELCELVVGEVEKLISTSTESEIVAEMEKLCGYLGSYKAECDSIVKTYVPSIIELLKKELTPALVCKELGLCTALKKLLHNAIEGMKSGEFCPICKMGVTYVDNLLKNNSTETEITAELEQICSVMGSYQTMCKQYMSTYLPLVFKFLAQELSPDLVCKELGLCTAAKPLLVKVAKKIETVKDVKSGVTCELCELVVGEVEKLISTKTESEIVAEMEKLCGYLGSYKEECDSIVKTYVPSIIELLKKELTPALVCKELGLCTALKKLLHNAIEGMKSGEFCPICKMGVTYVDNLLKNNSTETEITAELEQICSVMGSYQTMCKQYMSTYLPLVFKFLAQELSPDLVCKELGLCTAAKPLLVKVAKKIETVKDVKSGVTCELCELVVGEVEKLISTKTESEIVAEMEKLCGYLGSYKEECDSIVKTYVPSIIELLKKELTPALVCKELGLCTALKKLLHNAIEGMKSGEFCPICKMGVTYVDNLLKNNSTETEITAELEQICSVMGSYQTMCKQYMSTYLPLVFKFLAQELSPDLVCKELGLCTAAKPLLVKVAKKIETVKAGGVECTVCEFVVNYAEGLISTKTEDEIVKEVEKYCADLGSYKTECDAMVKMYLPKIIEMLKQEITPAVICKTLGLCSSTKASLSNQTKKVLKSTSCDVCEMVVGYVEGLISTKTEAEITAEVDKLCSYLWSYKAECDALVKGYLPKIIDLLKKELSPKLVCSEVGLCPALKKLLSRVNLKAVRGGEYCTICKLLVGYVDTMLKDSKEQTEITAELEKFCSYFGTYETKCKSYVSAYVPLVIKYLAAEMTPELVCKELSLCTSVKASKKQDIKFLLRCAVVLDYPASDFDIRAVFPFQLNPIGFSGLNLLAILEGKAYKI